MDRYDDYWKNFFINQFNWWRDVYLKTRNPEALKRLNEIKDILYKRWLLIFEVEPEVIKYDAKGQGYLF